ncbi:tetratricopeptide repeat protein 24 [Electrophorus electricus]|uniref:tetratricopeptide repeat protein 24 n=1 Tax=Electrophorus electricus TaxID=8005 RepID=UPI0015D084FB|nr:tetratricopeptide repeat protein 24 [Electrophorus electricus]
MASGGLPCRDSQKKKKKTSKKGNDYDVEDKEVQSDIENLTACGQSALHQGDYSEALDYFKKAFKAAVKLNKTKVQRVCAVNLGAAYVEAGKPEKGLHFLSRAEPGEKGERMADLQFNLAAAHEALEDHGRAVRHYLQAAQLYRSQGDGGSEGDTCVRLAHCHLCRKELGEAVESYLRAAESYKVAGKTTSAAVALKDAGGCMLQCDSFTANDIISVLTECLELSGSIAEQETLGKLYNAVGLSFSQLKLFAEAMECYEAALPLFHSTPRRLAVVLQNLGAAHNGLAQYQQALQYHREAAALHGSLGSRRAQGRCFCNLGFALSELGELEEAGESYLHAQQAFKDTDDSSGLWQACDGLGSIRIRKRDPEKAILYYKQALALLSKCKDVSSSVQERLVNSLSEALQLKLTMQQRAPIQRGPPARRLIQATNVRGRQLKGTDTRSTKGALDEQHSGELRNDQTVEDGSQVRYTKEWKTTEAYAQRKAHGDMTRSSKVLYTEPPNYPKALPEANRNWNNTYQKADVHYKNLDAHVNSQRDELMCGSSKQRLAELTCETPLMESTELSRPAQLDSEEATALYGRTKSRFCTVM